MSIPPLVCSTPPPPDQCEEDKDPEEFDLQYNLSQDDENESNDYDYASFSSYNNFQTAISSNKNLKTNMNNLENINKYDEYKNTKHENHEEFDGSNNKNDLLLGTSTASDIKPKCDEDTNIEDLGLKVISESMISDMSDIKDENVAHNNNVDNSVKDMIIPFTNIDIDDNVNISTYPQLSEENTSVVATSHQDLEVLEEHAIVEDLPTSLEMNATSALDISRDETITSDPLIPLKELENAVDDEFGDFDDFQFVEPEHKPASVFETCDNPWENKVENDSDFGTFTANFDANVNEVQNVQFLDTEDNDVVDQADSNIKQKQNYSDDDDFGDFDDFKSSAIEENEDTPEVSPLSQQVSILNLQSSDNEHQIIENINKILSSLFEEEIFEPKSEFEGKLETLLGETWGHLMETDIRQPYIVTWNNSLGQKTLLKALCIDSRNILFGPKWSYNMPKYAANLSSAPLQPQKQQAASSALPNETTNSTSNTADWKDPFTSDGQESCNLESESAVAETNTSETVFESASTKKSDKIYSSTLNMQQLRHINLPDTHIFTPTDSETPRSKTIHYDSGPPALLPQSVEENSKGPNISKHISDTVVKDAEDNSEYWEFQDFKSNPEVNTATPSTVEHHLPKSQEKNHETMNSEAELTKTKMVYQTQVLLPIKMEPTVPTLNWPDPGEVKETFDDFSDFISNSTWGNEKQETSHSIASEITDTKSIDEIKTLSKISDKHMVSETSKEATESNNSGDLDDEFDSFKSALPSKSKAEFAEFKFESVSNHVINNQNTSPQISSGQLPNFNYAFPKMKDKSDTISVTHVTRPNEALTQNLGNISNITGPSTIPCSISSGIQLQTNLLQPMTASSNTLSHQQKSGQILQPLSLESYSQINWPSPGIDLQDLSRFNPVETLQSLKSDLSASGHKGPSPLHSQKSATNSQISDDDVWGDFVSSKPKPQALPKKSPPFTDDDEWTDFVSSPSAKPLNGLMNTISLNVHTNSNMQKTNQNKFSMKTNQVALDIPTLNYVTPKSSNHESFNNKHFQNL